MYERLDVMLYVIKKFHSSLVSFFPSRINKGPKPLMVSTCWKLTQDAVFRHTIITSINRDRRCHSKLTVREATTLDLRKIMIQKIINSYILTCLTQNYTHMKYSSQKHAVKRNLFVAVRHSF